MYRKLTLYLIVLPLFFVLVACAQLGPVNSQDVVGQNAAQSAKTYREHNSLANYYDDLAKEMDARVAQKKELLSDYDEHSYYYGRGGQDFKSHTEANLRYYEEAAGEALKKADFHRKIAAELLSREYAKPTEALDPADTRKIKVKLNSNSDKLN